MAEFAELRIYEAIDAYGKWDDFVVLCASYALNRLSNDWLQRRGQPIVDFYTVKEDKLTRAASLILTLA